MVPVRHTGADLEAYRASTEAAAICKEIVVATSSNIQGKRYVSVEGWQAIAVAHGCAAGACDVEAVDGGVRAVGEVRRMSDGQLIARAEGFVGEDEPTWYGGNSRGRNLPKRADYAIRAMAQTRAISRACRSAFAHVVVMMNAGLATTPAEEVPFEGFDRTTGEVVEGEAVAREKVPGITKIKGRLNAMMKAGNKCAELDEFRKLVHDNRADIKTIRDANHEYWTGDGGDWEGFSVWMERRYAELTPRTESAEFQFLASVVQECNGPGELRDITEEFADKITSLDGEESRRFEELFNARELAVTKPTPMTAGAFGA